MKVLLTGASGFVGSHVLDRLVAERIPTAVLLRQSSSTRFISTHLGTVEVRYGGIDDVENLRSAMAGVTHVIHCAGATRARHARELFAVNQLGTRQVIEAMNGAGGVQRLVHVSSLAAGRSGTRAAPAREDDPPQPLSEYGRSKLAGEREVTAHCRGEFVVLRPGGVYGPRDAEFLRLFRAARLHLQPLFGGGRQELSLVFAPDLAEVIVRALTEPKAARQIVNVASAEIITARELSAAIAAATGTWTLQLPLPRRVLDGVCRAAAVWCKIRGTATVLAHGKHRELAAAGWVGDTARLRAIFGPVCATPLAEGVAATLAWYRAEQWL